jgi:hypothetical protein
MKITTTGTITAVLNNEFNFQGDKQPSVYYDPMLNCWVANSVHEKNDYQSFLITLWIPCEGDVTEKEYSIDGDFSNLTTAKASWIDVQGPGWAPFPALSGKMTVTIDIKQQTVTGSFNFTSRLSGDKELVVSKGLLDMKGFDDVRSTSKADATGTFTATLEGGAYKEYKANQFQLEALPANPVIGPNFPHWRAWSQTYSFGVPNRSLDIVVILIARDLGPGTYDLAKLKDKIRVTYNEVFPAAASYKAESGKLIVESVPEESATQGVFKGRLDFISEVSSNGVQIKFENGNFTFDSTTKTS